MQPSTDAESNVETAASPKRASVYGRVADSGGVASPAAIASSTARPNSRGDEEECAGAASVVVGGYISPRLEMRLALHQDIMSDEDLINYGNGLDLAAILGHDLSSYQKRTGREMLCPSPQQRSTGQIRTTVRAAGMASSCAWKQQHLQQNHSKMDTPQLGRRLVSPSTWSSSASVDQLRDGNSAHLSDLEKLARNEKTAARLRNGQRAANTEEEDQDQTAGLTSTQSTPKRKTRAL